MGFQKTALSTSSAFAFTVEPKPQLSGTKGLLTGHAGPSTFGQRAIDPWTRCASRNGRREVQMKRLMLLLALSLALGAADASNIHYRDFVIDLSKLTYSLQSDGVTIAAYESVPLDDPFTFTSVGDQLVTTVTFTNGELLTLGAPNEVVEIQYLGPSSAAATKSIEMLSLLGASGDLIGPTSWTYDQQFTCGNCIIAFSLGSITNSSFSFLGVTVNSTVTALTPGEPYSQFVFTVTGSTVKTSPGPNVGLWLQALYRQVTNVGPGKSLAMKITASAAYYAANDIVATCAMLDGFNSEVSAQSGKKIDPALAHTLIVEANTVEGLIGCQ